MVLQRRLLQIDEAFLFETFGGGETFRNCLIPKRIFPYAYATYHKPEKAAYWKKEIQLILRQISIWQNSVAGMTHFAGGCFLFNLHLKKMKFGLFVKPHVSNKKLMITKSAEN